jgi:SprA-related family
MLLTKGIFLGFAVICNLITLCSTTLKEVLNMEMSSSSHAMPSINLLSLSGNFQQLTGVSSKNRGQIPKEVNDKDTLRLSLEGQDLTQSPYSREKNIRISDKVNLDRVEVQKLQELKQRDLKVRTHEQAHLAAAGQYARGGASFTYQKGPDGASYAVGGEVSIDMGKERTPEATITKMQTIKRAALAPSSPSGTDRSIAAAAGMMESHARRETLVKNQEELLHADTAKNSTVVEQEVPSISQISGNTPPSPANKILRTVIAAYQRIANY